MNIGVIGMGNGQHLNRLANEQSPYLLQHAGNPVHWYPWGEEAFAMAREKNLPIFLSIGYSTCHWCHVMEEESFEDEEVAALLNEHFISIKVDREERPDIDHIYMAVCQAMTSSGGWPLTIIMTPDKEPFFAGTYFPKHDRGQRPGLLRILPAIASAWESDLTSIQATVDKVLQFLADNARTSGSSLPDTNLIHTAYNILVNRFDKTHGGFGSAPKFPSPYNLVYLTHYAYYYDDSLAREMVETTLQKMRMGGIFDQIGYGFHRYSTDREWLVPHFEKMLYDQALLLQAYTEAWELTRNPLYQQVVDEIFTYVRRELWDQDGGFYSAEDADSDGEEGKYYVWTVRQVEEILNQDEARLAKRYYSLRPEGNFREHPNAPFSGKNIPYLTRLPTDSMMEAARRKLLEHRSQRIHPRRDDKILADWNGLMIKALTRAGFVFSNPAYLQVARQAGDFIWSRMSTPDGHLHKSYRNGKAYGTGQLDDYVFMISAYLELYTTFQDVAYLQHALDLSEILKSEFMDNSGGFFLNSSRGEALIVRPKTGYDGALPSGNSLAVENSYRLAHITGKSEWSNIADEILMAFSDQLQESVAAHTAMITGYMDNLFQSKEVIIVSPKRNAQVDRFIAQAYQDYTPAPVLIVKTADNATDLIALAPWLEPYKMINEKTTFYICNNFICQQPTNNLKTALDYLHE